MIDLGHSVSIELREWLEKNHKWYVKINVAEELIKEVIPNKEQYKNIFVPGVKQVGSRRIISNGYPGKPGDVIVDDVEDPKFIIGKSASDMIFERHFEIYG